MVVFCPGRFRLRLKMLKNCFHLAWEHETIISGEERWTKKTITTERPLTTQFKITFQIKFTTEPTNALLNLIPLLTCFKNLLNVEISPKDPTTISVDANGAITASISPEKLLTTKFVRVEILRLQYSSTSGGEVKFTYVLRVDEQVRL